MRPYLIVSLAATLFVDRHVSNNSVEWKNARHSSKDSSTVPAPEKLTPIQTLVNVNRADLFWVGYGGVSIH